MKYFQILSEQIQMKANVVFLNRIFLQSYRIECRSSTRLINYGEQSENWERWNIIEEFMVHEIVWGKIQMKYFESECYLFE